MDDKNKLDRFNLLNTNTNQEKQKEPAKIKSLKLSNYRFFYGDNDENNKFDFDGKNVLIYGENGSGKSSIYKALELLSKNSIEKGYFQEEANSYIFESDEYDIDDVFISFEFTNGNNISFNKDSEENEFWSDFTFPFIEQLKIFKPMLDYKKLLRIHYINNDLDKINLYPLFQDLLKDYPLENGEKIFDKETLEILELLDKILNKELLFEINNFLNSFEDKNSPSLNKFQIDCFETKPIKDPSDNLKSINAITLKVNFGNISNPISNYHSFLNESRLSALAISIYFASIKRLFNVITNDCMKILVLDDLLISFDMNNRLKLLNILKEDFSDFQIFFFTHDRELFELYKDKMDWKKYEIYCDDSQTIPKAIVKKSDSYIERAKKFYISKDYDVSASFLRKEFESILKNVLKEKINNTYILEKPSLDTLISDAIYFSSSNIKEVLEKLKSDKQHILNPASHDDNKNIYAEELRSTIEDLKLLKNWNPEIKIKLPKYTNMKLTLKTDENKDKHYIFNLLDDVYSYQDSLDITHLSISKCKTLYCYFGDDKSNCSSFDKNYNSIDELRNNILEFNNGKDSFIYYKNNSNRWIKYD